jgi:hypothetical protein
MLEKSDCPFGAARTFAMWRGRERKTNMKRSPLVMAKNCSVETTCMETRVTANDTSGLRNIQACGWLMARLMFDGNSPNSLTAFLPDDLLIKNRLRLDKGLMICGIQES